MRRFFALTVLLAFASGCASIEEASGVPEPFSWTYFQESPAQVADATALALRQLGYRVEAVREVGDGAYGITVSSRSGSAGFAEIRIVPFEYTIYTSRAQTFPQGRALPGALRQAVIREL